MSYRSNRKFAEAGLNQTDLAAEMEALRRGDRPWNEPKNLRANYDAGDDVVAVANAAYAAHIGDNAIYSASA
ncbi:MAG: hypothetical protein EXQ99_01060 [Alphaproteobacteria bacterium]|nr:hypothetical protein [Alphaproteobacteria bacterium]